MLPARNLFTYAGGSYKYSGNITRVKRVSKKLVSKRRPETSRTSDLLLCYGDN